MLVFKEIKDYNVVKEFLANESINYFFEFNNSLIYGGFEDENLFGLCIIHIKENKGEIKYLAVKDNFRGSNLGDGLLRSALNKLDKMGINFVFYPNVDTYLLKIGFQESHEGYLFIELPDFFNNPCSNCGR